MPRVAKPNIRSRIAMAESAKLNNDLNSLERKIILAIEGFMTEYSESTLRDRNRLSQENALVVAEYVIAMKREVNPRPNYIQYTIQFLAELSRLIGIRKNFIDMTRQDIQCYLDKCRKPESGGTKFQLIH